MPTTERTWTERAEALPGSRDMRFELLRHMLTIQWHYDARVRGIVTDFCERQGWLHGIEHIPAEPGTYRALYRLPNGGMGVTPLGGADTAVQAIILAAEARRRVDPARGWC